ncbi:PQQ-binding-like beta-propeller repeat protein [Frigoribacterium sp. 2-23]|uniref:outer membrane protein assembly factor BamB family protein n=1 Tax=Frigoribacterium sp. 2-23 TaxID=3415006 RepID=UPI003C7040BD
MVPVTPPWRPPRPAPGGDAWGGAAGGAGRDAASGASTEGASTIGAAQTIAAPPGRPSRRRDRRERLLRASRASVSIVALVTVVVLAAGVGLIGSAAQPAYGDGAPWGGTTVDDTRSQPVEAAWRLDLAKLLSPDAPPRCLHFWPSAAADGLVAVSSSVDLDFGSAAEAPECRQFALANTSSRVALIDTTTGHVRWVHDIAADVAGADPLSIPSSQVVPAVSRVLVQTQATGSTVLVALDLDDGHVVETTRGRRDLPSVSVDTRGRLQLRTYTGAGDSGDGFALVDAADLGTPVWQGQVDVGTTPLLIDGGLLTVQHDRVVRVDGSTGAEHPFAAHPDSIAVPPGDTGLVYALDRTRDGRRTVSALAPDGTARWTSTTTTSARSIAVTRRCVVATASDQDEAVCLDPSTGAARWTADLHAPFSATALPGQTSDDVFVLTRGTDSAVLVCLDGASGTERFRTPIGALDEAVAASRTVVYVGTEDSRSYPRGITAIDAVTGAGLWSVQSGDTVSYWGGRLVQIDDRGIARHLAAGDRAVTTP